MSSVPGKRPENMLSVKPQSSACGNIEVCVSRTREEDVEDGSDDGQS